MTGNPPRFPYGELVQFLQFLWSKITERARKPWPVRRGNQLKERLEVEKEHLELSSRPRGDTDGGSIRLARLMSIDGSDPLAQPWKIVSQSESRLGLWRDWTTGRLSYVPSGDNDQRSQEQRRPEPGEAPCRQAHGSQ